MIARQKFRTKEAKKRHRIRLGIHVFFLTISLFVAIGSISYISKFEIFQLKDVHVQNSGVLNNDELASVIDSSLEGEMIGLFPKRSTFIFSHKSLENTLKSQFPRIDTVELKRAGFYAITATVKERVPGALWCGDIVPQIAYRETSNELRNNDDLWGTCYLVDKKGYIYARAPLFTGNMFPKYYGSLEKAEPIAQQYLPEDDFLKWQELYSSLTENGVEAQAMLFVDEHDIELYLTSGLKILIPRKEDASLIKRRLFAVLDSGNIDENKEVEYIDLRFGKKAFIKYLGEKVENET